MIISPFFKPLFLISDKLLTNLRLMISNIFGWTPSLDGVCFINIIESDQELSLEFRAVGLSKDDIKVEYNAESGMLQIRSKRELSDPTIPYIHRDFWEDQINQDIDLNYNGINVKGGEDISSVLSRGVLTITIKKSKEELKKNVINVGTIELG